jgi:hypothetical protein
MGPVVQFTLALAVAITSLAGSSIAWPKLTNQQRPQLLQQVHDAAIKTPPGQRAAEVLGVTDESHVEPVNLGKLASDGINGVKSTVQKRVQTIVVSNAVNELTRQFDKLPDDQKVYIQQALCQPQPTVTGTP